MRHDTPPHAFRMLEKEARGEVENIPRFSDAGHNQTI